MALTTTQLFTPATQAQWYATLLALAQTLGISTTSWLVGGITRTILVVLSYVLAGADLIISTMAQGGFLSDAANVTIDPSITPGAAPGWLDVLANAVYNVQRVQATFASGTVNITNTSPNTYGPFAPGTYHIANPSTGATYSNTAQLTILPSPTVTPANFQADIAGAAGSSAIGTITQTVTSLVGVTVTNPNAFSGSNAESNPALVARAQLKLQSLSPNGPKGAYDFFARSAAQILAAQTPAVTIDTITRSRTDVNISTGAVTTTCALAAGPVPGVSNLAVTNATNNGSGLVRLTVSSTTGLANGNVVTVTGVNGVPGANTTALISGLTGTTLDLVGTTFSGAYVSGGSIEGGDLGQVDIVVRANAVPNGVTYKTQSATNPPGAQLAIVATIYVPSAQVAAYTAILGTSTVGALASYINGLPIGGAAVDGASNVVSYGEIEAILGSSAPYVQSVSNLTINGTTVDVPLATTDVATLNSFTPTVVGV